MTRRWKIFLRVRVWYSFICMTIDLGSPQGWRWRKIFKNAFVFLSQFSKKYPFGLFRIPFPFLIGCRELSSWRLEFDISVFRCRSRVLVVGDLSGDFFGMVSSWLGLVIRLSFWSLVFLWFHLNQFQCIFLLLVIFCYSLRHVLSVCLEAVSKKLW